MSYLEKLRNPLWRAVRRKVCGERDRWTCRDCQKGTRDALFELHHLWYVPRSDPWTPLFGSIDEALAWDYSAILEGRGGEDPFNHLRTLCQDCHEKLGELQRNINTGVALYIANLTDDQRAEFDRHIFDLCISHPESIIAKALLES